MVQKQKEKNEFWTRNKYTLCLCLLLAFAGAVFSYEKVRVVNILQDTLTNSTVVIDYEEHTIHEGRHFYICDFTTLALNEELNFSFYTNTTIPHMTFEIEGTVGVTINVYENVTVTGGTIVDGFNNNRNSSYVEYYEVRLNPTVTNGGSKIFGSSKGTSRTSGFIKRNNELILRENTTYMFNIISGGASNIVSYCGEWYNGFEQ